MRNGLILGGLALVVAIAALAIGIVALVLPTDDSDEFDDDIEFRLSDRGEFTVNMVVQALNRYKAEGRQATIDYYNTPESSVGEWYVFILDENDRIVAHRNPAVLGEDVKGDIGVDSTGYRYGDVLLSVDERGLWVDYMFLNLATGNQEFKHTWVVRHDGLIFGSGWYQILPKSSN